MQRFQTFFFSFFLNFNGLLDRCKVDIDIDRCVGRETEGRRLAVKALFKGRIDNGIQMSQLMCELAILRRLRHDNLIQLVDEFNDSNIQCIVLPLYVVRLQKYSSSSDGGGGGSSI